MTEPAELTAPEKPASPHNISSNAGGAGGRTAAQAAPCFNAVRFRSSRLGRDYFCGPIDPSDGSYFDFRIDFEYPGILPFRLTRTYSGKDTVDGLLGTKWICNWSQRLIYNPTVQIAILEDGDGEVLLFDLGKRPEFNARHLKAPHYHLTGIRQRARLFDTRSQQTLIFAATEDSPGIGRLQSIEDRNDNHIDFIYDDRGLSRIVHSDGIAFRITTTPQGRIESIAAEEKGRLRPLASYSYDPAGTLTDVYGLFTGESHYAYTESGLLNHWHDSGATRVDFDYDPDDRVIATRTPDGMRNHRFVYDPAKKKTQDFNAVGDCTTRWFNNRGLLIRTQAPTGGNTFHVYNDLDRRISTTDALGRVTTFRYDILGYLTQETDWAGRTTGYAYDIHGQLIRLDHPDGAISAWKHDKRGNLFQVKEPGGITTKFSYDDDGRLLMETGPGGVSIRLGYDERGRLSSWRNAMGQTTRFKQDGWGRLWQVTDPEGHTTRYRYEAGPGNPQGNLSRIIHPDGGEERFSYDREGLIASHIAGEGQTTRYRYGAFGLLKSVTDPTGQTARLDYDMAARLQRITNAAGQTWTWSYNPAGQLTAETDWAGRQTRYVRDAIGRLTRKHFPDGTDQRLTWDTLDRVIQVDTPQTQIGFGYNAAGRIVRATTFTADHLEPESDMQFIYDKKGRLKREIQNGIAIDYRYDTTDRCLSRTSPSGETTYAFDLLGQFRQTASNGHTLELTRNALGLETERVCRQDQALHDAFALKQRYDRCGRLSFQMAGKEDSSLSDAHAKPAQVVRWYNWDRSGSLIGIKTNKRGARSRHYALRDETDLRLHQTTMEAPAAEPYGCNVLMNLADRNGCSYRYDARGRMAEKRLVEKGISPMIWHYLWDDLDRLTEAQTPDGAIWRYAYDAFGRRIRKECVEAGESGMKTNTMYLWQGATLSEEWTVSADEGDRRVKVIRWHFQPGTFQPMGKETLTLDNGMATGVQFFPMVTDHLGGPKELFDLQGNCVWQAGHILQGETTVARQKHLPGCPSPEVDCSLRFQNQWEDKETGLFYNLHRYYDPDSGRYLSIDPIRRNGGLRRHGYVHDPLQWLDPLGLRKSEGLKSKQDTCIQKLQPDSHTLFCTTKRKSLTTLSRQDHLLLYWDHETSMAHPGYN